MNKKTIFSIATGTLLIGAFIVSCNTSADKVDHAQSDVRAAEKNLAKAQADYEADVTNFKAQKAEEIAANDQQILELKKKIEFEKKDAKKEYEKTLAEIEMKNAEAKKKMLEYKAGEKNNWEQFKADFEENMSNISKKFKTIVLKPVI